MGWFSSFFHACCVSLFCARTWLRGATPAQRCGTARGSAPTPSAPACSARGDSGRNQGPTHHRRRRAFLGRGEVVMARPPHPGVLSISQNPSVS